MKILTYILFVLFLISKPSFGQIPNSSFESWTNSIPDDWNVNSSPPLFMPVSQSTDAHTGNYAIKGLVINDSGVSFAPYIYPIPNQFGFPVFQNHDTLYGWFKSNMISTDLGSIEVYAYDNAGTTIGIGSTFFGSSLNYDQFAIPISYTSGLLATEMSITMQIVDTSVGGLFHVGSSFTIDDLTFQPITTDIHTQDQFPVIISPNPVSDYLTITGAFESEKNYEVKIYNSLGILAYQKIFNSNAQSSAAFNVSSLSDGCYFLIVSDNKKYSAKRIILSR